MRRITVTALPRRRLALASASLVMLFAASAAQAGDTYLLDHARTDAAPTTEPGIVRIDAGQGQTRLTLSPVAPAEPLHETVGMDVIESTGVLLVTDAGGGVGYPGSTDFGPCAGNSCGALLAVDPNTGTATMVAGPTSPADTTNLLENPYDVVHRPAFGDALVSDQGKGTITRVDLATGVETQFNQRPGLHNPWGIAEDPTNGDILVANTGPGFNRFNEYAPNEHPDSCSFDNGFLLRLSSAGALKRVYCHPDFRRPRSLIVDAAGTIFVLDPVANARNPVVGSGSGATVGFGTVFAIEPGSGNREIVTAGGMMATPSGVDFNYAGTRLLMADETLFPFGGPCVSGCGGVLRLNPDGGGQSLFSARGAGGGSYVDPIDIAVDRDGQPAPLLRVNTVPLFFENINRPEGAPESDGGAITELPFFPVLGDSRIKIVCLKATCKRKKKLKQLTGKARRKAKRKEKLIAYEVVSGGEAVFRMKGGRRKPGGKTRPLRLKTNRLYRTVVFKPDYNGRFQDFKVVRAGDGTLSLRLRQSGCLRPGKAKVKRKKPRKTVVACPNI